MKIALLAAYFIVLLWIGFKCRKGAGSVSGFVLGGRSVGAWLTAFAYGTSYFSAVVFVGYAAEKFTSTAQPEDIYATARAE